MSETASRSDAGFFQERGFMGRMGFGKTPALVVIDFQKGFSREDQPLGSNLDAELAKTAELISLAHAHELPVFFTVCSYAPPFTDAGVWIRKIGGLSSLEEGTANVELDDRLDRRPGDALIAKKYASCFFGTDFSSRLTALGVDTLILAGCTTSGCVRATAVDACQSGLRPIVVRECVGDRDAAAHEQSLFDLDAKYADVLTLDECRRGLERIRQNPA